MTLQLSVDSPINLTINETICEGDSLLFGGDWLTVGGTYVDTLLNTSGCDSLITTLNLEVEACDPCEGYDIESNGVVLNDTLYVTVCDTVSQGYHLNLTTGVGDTLIYIGQVNGSIFNESGTDVDLYLYGGTHIISTTGCDEECEDQLVVVVDVVQCLIVQEEPELLSLPNPVTSNNRIRIQSKDGTALNQFIFTSPTGKVLQQGDWSGQLQGEIDLSTMGGIPGGMYFVRMKGHQTLKIVIVRM
jgi:hypothetical protein